MSDVIARLRAADPFVEQPYEHPHLDSVITKITRTPPVATSVWRRFQLRLGAAVTGTTLVTVGAIAALQGAGSSLPVLNFAAPASTSSHYSAAQTVPAAATGATTQFTRTNVSYHVRAGVGLSAASSAAPAYELIHPARPATLTSRLAKVFGLSGTPTVVELDAWRVRGGRATLTYANTPLASWTFTRTPQASDFTTWRQGPLIDDPLRARALNTALHFHDQLGTPTISRATAHATVNAVPMTYSVTYVHFPVLVEGIRTNLSVNFIFSPTGVLLGASGPALLLSAPYTYPVFSPRDGVQLLNRHQLAPLPLASSQALGAVRAPTQMHSARDVTLTRATIALNVFQLRDGASWLVPVYNYTGTTHGRRTTISLLAPKLNFLTNTSTAAPVLSDTTRP